MELRSPLMFNPIYMRIRDAAFDRLVAKGDLRDARCQEDVDRAQRELDDADARLARALEEIND